VVIMKVKNLPRAAALSLVTHQWNMRVGTVNVVALFAVGFPFVN
jgi:hypothetical protein